MFVYPSTTPTCAPRVDFLFSVAFVPKIIEEKLYADGITHVKSKKYIVITCELFTTLLCFYTSFHETGLTLFTSADCTFWLPFKACQVCRREPDPSDEWINLTISTSKCLHPFSVALPEVSSLVGCFPYLNRGSRDREGVVMLHSL